MFSHLFFCLCLCLFYFLCQQWLDLKKKNDVKKKNTKQKNCNSTIMLTSKFCAIVILVQIFVPPSVYLFDFHFFFVIQITFRSFVCWFFCHEVQIIVGFVFVASKPMSIGLVQSLDHQSQHRFKALEHHNKSDYFQANKNVDRVYVCFRFLGF